MKRRTLLKAAAAAGTLAATERLSAPALAQGAAARALRFVPQANLANFDPIWGTQYVVRNASTMVWDTLYGVDEELQPQRQMVEAEEVSSDGLTWTFRLRPGLKFHDGEPVLAKDVAASLNRWAARDQMGLLIKTIQQDLAPVDDRRSRAAERRDRLVGESDFRPRAAVAQEPQCRGRHRRPARQYRRFPHESPLSAVQ